MEALKYKVLIADDEYWMREKIRNIMNWEEYKLEFMEPAENGKEVIKKIDECVPDILITDINMPFLNGIDLIEVVKETHPEIVIFVISGYDDFTYVKPALLAGAVNYLLKPVNKIDLVNAISTALEIISSQKENKLQILKASSLIQDRELSLLVDKDHNTVLPTNRISGKIDFSNCGLLLIKIHNFNPLMSKYKYDMNLLSYTLKKDIKEIIGGDNMIIFNHIFRSNEFIIATEENKSSKKKMAIKILKHFKNKIESPISICISEHSFSLDSIHMAYIECVSMLMARSYTKESVIKESCDKDNRGEVVNKFTTENKKKLESLLKSGNQSAISELAFEEIGLKYCEGDEWAYVVVKQTVTKFCNVIIDFVSQNINTELADLENLVELADKIIDNFEIDGLCDIIEEIITTVSLVTKEEPVGSIKTMVKKAADYIEYHYFEELTLQALSEKYNVESSYFSKVFKHEIGENLMTYIAKKRIKKSKEHMVDKSLNLTEIAFMVGYDDYTYFSRVFKKLTGTSPRDYRLENQTNREADNEKV